MVKVVPNVKSTKQKKNKKSLRLIRISIIMCKNILTILNTLNELASLIHDTKFKYANKCFVCFTFFLNPISVIMYAKNKDINTKSNKFQSKVLKCN